MSTCSASARDALRQIVQSQMCTSPFRHVPSLKAQRLHSNMLAKIEFDVPLSVDAKAESDKKEEEENDEDDEMLCNDWNVGESDELYNILLSTMRGEGNTSVHLFGTTSFGKSALLSSVMQRIREKFGRDVDSLVYIHMNGSCTAPTWIRSTRSSRSSRGTMDATST